MIPLVPAVSRSDPHVLAVRSSRGRPFFTDQRESSCHLGLELFLEGPVSPQDFSVSLGGGEGPERHRDDAVGLQGPAHSWALVKTVARLRFTYLVPGHSPDQGREKRGKREEPRPQCGVPESSPASLLVIHGHSFLWIKSPSPPLPGCSFIAESQALHAISRLSASAPAVPSAKCLLHCPGLATTSSFFRAQLGCCISPCVASPESLDAVICPSLHSPLALHLCPPSAVAGSKCLQEAGTHSALCAPFGCP